MPKRLTKMENNKKSEKLTDKNFFKKLNEVSGSIAILGVLIAIIVALSYQVDMGIVKDTLNINNWQHHLGEILLFLIWLLVIYNTILFLLVLVKQVQFMQYNNKLFLLAISLMILLIMFVLAYYLLVLWNNLGGLLFLVAFATFSICVYYIHKHSY